VDFDFDFAVEKGSSGFGLIPVNEDSKAVLEFAYLTQAGLASRVRECPSCQNFFYAHRVDQRFCKESCKVGFWQKTPLGKETKKLYMRKWRATVRKLDSKYTTSDLTGERRKESGRARKLG
jgi:hypothetical protein